ncbi:2-C-methyl-D-erythritol 2,4-cyclodiphosphate synthase [Pseudoalteromonas sp. T1lg75]|uniref:2-C-methyl-D-erythritol 2,4-cyclodiphosphate synthase n=1 Tax=Pseudoalteromonas sp. T1lg75 TaxID=2077102 RepID=UPI000CF69DE1|nr:2-C-methyl-D-erythritol 2,4-cyclodiphosphate synthase [Pseudoalteromonas sp. T1lg75]
MIRIGHGFDVHRFGGHGPLTIGGVKVDYEQGFIAHSDGDVAIHALCDALLGAMALGDIGKHFPDTSDEFAGIDSRILLRRVMSEVHERAFVVANVDLTIVAQAPKMSPHIDAMRGCLAADLAISLDQVNVKATTTEKLGYTGRKEGIAAHAVALLVQQP